MRKPAKKYFTPESATDSIMLIRKWMSGGASHETIARWISAEYAKATDVATRRHLGFMLCAVYDSVSDKVTNSVASKCADMFGIDRIKGHSISESAMIESIRLNGMVNFQWLEEMSPEFSHQSVSLIGSLPKCEKSDIFTLRDCENLFPIDSSNKIYALRSIDGNIWLISLCDCKDPVIIDEEVFNNTPAQYFTEHYTFISPVWIINIICRVLEYLLERVGYPPMNIRKRVIFYSPEVKLLNYNSFKHDKAWTGVDVLTAKDKNLYPLLPPSISLSSRTRDVMPEQLITDMMLFLCLSSVSEIVKHHELNEIANADDEMFTAWCKELEIFEE